MQSVAVCAGLMSLHVKVLQARLCCYRWQHFPEVSEAGTRPIEGFPHFPDLLIHAWFTTISGPWGHGKQTPLCIAVPITPCVCSGETAGFVEVGRDPGN